MITRAERPQGLVSELFRIASLTLVLSLLALFGFFVLTSINMADSALKKDLQALAQVLGTQSSAALVFNDAREANDNLGAAKFRDGVQSACLYQPNKKLFASYTVDSGQTCPSEFSANNETEQNALGLIQYAGPISNSGEDIGFISLVASTAPSRNVIYGTFWRFAIVFIIIVLSGYLLLRYSLQKAIAPLQNLETTAKDIARNPLSDRRAEAVSQNNEIGVLVDVFNNMLDKLCDENARLLTSEERFRSLAENAPIGIYELDPQFNFTYSNRCWREITQIDQPTALSDLIDISGLPNKEAHYKFFDKAQQNMASRQFEYHIVTSKDHKRRHLIEQVSPVFAVDTDKGSYLQGYIGSLLDVTDLKNAQAELEDMAYCCPLTQLPNRRYLFENLDSLLNQAELENNSVSVVMMDLDHFKKVNDTLGHDAGDEMLIKISERLRNVVSRRDTVCRLGGDEFLIVLDGVESKHHIEKITERILIAIRSTIDLRDRKIDSSCSLGVARYPEDGTTTTELMRNADLALYESKDQGKDRVVFFSEALANTASERVELERKLQRAIKSDLLSFHVQPKVSLTNWKVVSAEVLIRWEDELEGMIPPDKFIPIAEDTGLILPLGDRLLDKVFASISEHMALLKQLGIESFAINLSARQFYDKNLLTMIRDKLDQYQIDAQMIEFELTESSLIENIANTISVMQSFKTTGCKISIDDFGTGYSSLSYLKQLPIDVLKVDRSFISDIPEDKDDMEISSAIIAMAHKLGLSVVAEGTETVEQIAFLKEQNCEYAQGYLIAKPMPMEQLLASIEEINEKCTVISNQIRFIEEQTIRETDTCKR